MPEVSIVHTNAPPEVIQALEDAMSQWKSILPGWCREIVVKWFDSADDCALSITVSYEYRRAELNVYPNFISHPHRRSQAVLHEFIHVLLEPFSNYVTDVKNELLKEKPELKEWVEETQRYAEESTVCDMVLAFESHSQEEEF